MSDRCTIEAEISAAAAARRELAAITDACPIPIFMIDADHVITHWNRALEHISGFAARDMIGTRRQWQAFYPRPRPVLADLIVDGAGRGDVEAHYPGKSRPSLLIDGAYEADDFYPAMRTSGAWLFFTAAPLRDERGAVIGAIETLQDISEQKRAERELREHGSQLESKVRERTAELVERSEQLKREIAEREHAEQELKQAHARLAEKAANLEQANEELSQYAHMVSHDLRAPLRAIRNYVDFLREDLAPAIGAEQGAYFDGLERALRHGDQLVEDLLDYSRVGRVEPKARAIDLREFLGELVRTLDLPPDARVVFAGGWPRVRADPTLLRQAVGNLLLNAVKYNVAAEKRVELSWHERASDGGELAVRDNGIGIEARHHEAIFRMFHRLHTQREFEGSGIGLAIVRKAATRMGGEVRVVSAAGEGSTFFLALPRVPEHGEGEAK